MSDALFPKTAPPSGGYTVLARRYRSTGFDELVGQEPIVHALQNAIAHGRTSHAYLFTGTRGVGKTSMARIFAKALNCTAELSERDAIAAAILRGDDIDVIEIDGASNRGIDKARELIASAGILPARCPYKIYIIDEVHMLTKEAFNALLKLMEEPPPHVKFILCTTDPNAVPATIQSRCQRFDFRNIGSARIAEHLRHVAEQEGVEAEEGVLLQVARLANGSMRDGLSLLDRLIAAADGSLTATLLEQVLGLPDRTLVEGLVDAIADGDAPEALRRMHELLQRGNGVEQAIDALADQFRAVMLCTVVGPDSGLVDRAGEGLEIVRGQAERFDAPALVHMIALCDAVAQHA
ncbi:MAG: DNA polymerase III subunit gamma/tau, partial [Phycisphaerales bacterium]|nr:DNA polymerase III subunit gamma/tau [Phycisphaerales bacterium]